MAIEDIYVGAEKTLRVLKDSKGREVGYLVLPNGYDGSDPSRVQHFDNYTDAQIAAGNVNKKKVDKVNGVDIFAVWPGNSVQLKKYTATIDGVKKTFGSLTSARKALGWEPAAPAKKAA